MEGSVDTTDQRDGRRDATVTRPAAHPDWWCVRDVMTTHPVCVAPTASAAEVVDLLLAHGVSGLPVTDARGHLLGVVTEADLVRREAQRSISGPQGEGRSAAGSGRAETAAALMSSPAVTVSPDDDLPTTARTLLTCGVRRLPVVAGDGRVVGIVSRRDLLTPAWDLPG